MSGHDPDRAEDRELLGQLGPALGHDPDAEPPAERVAALRAAAERMAQRAAEQTAAGSREVDASADDGPGTVVAMPGRPVRRALLTGGVAAGFGGVAGYLVRRSTEPAPVAAPPTEPVRFEGPADVERSELINHTWGTELVIDLRGLDAGATYDVVYDTTAGDVGAGSLLAVAGVLMKCRFNAASLRADVRAIEVRAGDGSVVLRSQLPAVSA